MPCRLLASNRIYPALSVHRLLDSRHFTRLDRATFPKVNIAAALGTLMPFGGQRRQGTRKDDRALARVKAGSWILDPSYYSDNYSWKFHEQSVHPRLLTLTILHEERKPAREVNRVDDVSFLGYEIKSTGCLIEKYQGSTSRPVRQQQIS